MNYQMTILNLMNRQRIIEYGEKYQELPTKMSWNRSSFSSNETHRFIAFGMLKSLTLTYQDTAYVIYLGIGNIIAIEKRRGNGRRLMVDIQKYLNSQNMIGLGFCQPSRAGFYQKCGCDVVSQFSKRFRYSKAHQTKLPEILEPVRELLCYNPHQQFIDILQSSNELIYTNVPFW